MPIYKQTTEIANIDKIWTSISKDIVEVYFGDKNVFSVWAEIENTLPLTVYASGDDLVNYKVFGNTENGESVGELTENLFDPNATDTTNGYRFSAYLPSSGNIVSITSELPSFAVSEYIGVPNDNFITLVNVGMVEAPRLAICFYNANKKYISGTEYGSNINKTVEIPSGSVYFRFTIVLSAISSIMIVEGTTTPTSYIPYGYKLPMTVGSRNLLDKDLTKFEDAKCFTANGSIQNHYHFCVSDYIPILPGTVYSIFNPNSGNTSHHCFYDSNKNFLMSFPAYGQNLHTATSPANAAYIRCSILSYTRYPSAFASAMLFVGSTAPTEYIPYSRTDTPIYIGSDPLAEDEYVDFGEQKVYRMEGGTLTPTDPPTPIPALPTIEGETIIDYNPSETPAVEPEKMYAKYRKQGT